MPDDSRDRNPDRRLDRWLDRLGRAAMPLALLLTVLLAVQWPLRDAPGALATRANDLGQVVFALYVACGVRHAARRGAHLVARPDLAARPGRRWRWGAALCVLPWALTVLVLSLQPVLASVRSLERFPESFTDGYWVLKLALPLLAGSMVIEALRTLRRGDRTRP